MAGKDERHCAGFHIESLDSKKAILRFPISNLEDSDNIEILFPGKVSEKLIIKVNGTVQEELTIPCEINKLKCCKKVKSGSGGDITLTLYKKDGQPRWPAKNEWPENQSAPPIP